MKNLPPTVPDKGPDLDGMPSRAELYKEFEPLVRRLIVQYGVYPQLREDLSGEIYCRFCALIDLYNPERGVPLRPYLVRQLKASVYTYARSHWRSTGRELPLETSVELLDHNFPADPTDEWIRRLLVESMTDAIRHALARLPERQRNVVLWRYFHNHSFEEIGVRLNVQPATTRSMLRHALNSMRRWLTDNQMQLD